MDLTSKSVDRLVGTLNSKGIAYCHWKSNFYLARTLSGETDLDLLVDRRSLSQAITVLRSLNYKPAAVRWGPITPSISHYYGFDPQLGQLTHIHLFSRILTGESFVKSHLFPFESMMLENTYYIGQIRVTSKPAELVLSILRTFIKYGSLLDLVYLHRRSEDIQAELRWLQADSDMSEALCMLRKYCPVIDEQLFIKCVNIISTNGSLAERIRLAQQVRRRLRIYAKYSGLTWGLAYLHLVWGQVQRRLNGNKKNKILDDGGAVIAFVGPDATGKSTLLSECASWLGKVFAVQILHAGKPPSSFLTAPVDTALPLVRKLLPRLRTSHIERHALSSNPTQSQDKVKGLPSLIYALRAVTLAWDRRQLLVRARRAAASGEIVLCDRYPSEILGVMDSRRLRENPISHGIPGAVYNWLARLEEQLYKQIPPPDIVLRLNVSVETAKKRNRERIKSGKGTDLDVEFRHRQSQKWHTAATKCIYDIDAEQSIAQTILSVKQAIWEAL